MFKKLFERSAGDDWRNIRKDAGDLTYEDLRRFPAWEFCLDEENVDGQSETTVRPVHDVGARVDALFDGFIPADITFADGSRHFGAVLPNAALDGPAPAYTEVWLPKRAQEYISEPLPHHWNQIIYADAVCIRFGPIATEQCLPREETRELIRLVYAVLGTASDRMWPITVTPRVAIEGCPSSWQLQGWQRSGAGGVVR